MKLRFSTVGALLLVGVLMISSFVGSSPQTCWTSPGIAWAVPDETSQQKKLPPLIVDTDSPLMLEEAGKKADPDKEIAPSVLENTACYVCHENYRTEELVAQHADNDVGCVDCHGKSYAHRNDENNTTPPDVMFPRNRIEEGCASCHDSHDVSAAEVVARLRERVPHMSQSQDLACTDCHGYHRLDHRTVVWNRETRELLTGSKQSTQDKRGPSWNSLKSLAGTWVQAGKDGKPSDKVVSTYRVTAAGSAIVEVLFPGSEQEMVTVYHQDGDDLLLTHYCAARNQPRMKCNGDAEPNLLRFEFVDATNMRSTNDPHMRSGTIKIVDHDHIQSQWQAYDKGQPAGVVEFDLLRKAE